MLGIDLPPPTAALALGVISSEYISSRHAVALVILWCFVTGKTEGKVGPLGLVQVSHLVNLNLKI